MKIFKKFSPLLIMVIIGVIAGSVYMKNQEKVYVSGDFPLVSNIDSMVEGSELIVLGKFTREDSTWNMARNPSNPQEPDSEIYTEGVLYNFKINKVIEGEVVNQVIKVNFRKEGNIELRDEDGNWQKVVQTDPLFLEPEINQKYLLFLGKDQTFDDIYYGAVEPFQIMINKDNKAELKTQLKENKSIEQKVKLGNKKYTVVNELAKEEFTDSISGKDLNSILKEIKATYK